MYVREATLLCGISGTVHRRKRLGPALIEYYTDNYRAIRYYHTDIIKFFTDGRIILNSGGHKTVTTKKYINLHLPDGFHLVQREWDWFLLTRDYDLCVFFDGMNIANLIGYRAQQTVQPADIKIWRINDE